MEAEDFARLLDAAAGGVESPLGKALTKAERQVAREQRRSIPVRSGLNQSRITVERVGPLEGLVGSDEPQGERLELGTATRAPIPWALGAADDALDDLADAADSIIEALFR